MAGSLDTDVERHVRRIVTKHACAGKLPGLHVDADGLEVLAGYGEYEGTILFHFVTFDNIEVSVKFDLNDFSRDPRGYLDAFERGLEDGIEIKRLERLIDAPTDIKH